MQAGTRMHIIAVLALLTAINESYWFSQRYKLHSILIIPGINQSYKCHEFCIMQHITTGFNSSYTISFQAPKVLHKLKYKALFIIFHIKYMYVG